MKIRQRVSACKLQSDRSGAVCNSKNPGGIGAIRIVARQLRARELELTDIDRLGGIASKPGNPATISSRFKP